MTASGSYAVAWREPGGAVATGSARVEAAGLVLRGAGPEGDAVRRRVPLSLVASVRIGRAASDRVRGTRSVVLDLGHGIAVAVAPLGAGQVFELAELVAAQARAS